MVTTVRGTGRPRALPQGVEQRDVVTLQLVITRDEHQSVDARLTDERPVERVLVVEREGSGVAGMACGKGQVREVEVVEAFLQRGAGRAAA